MNYNASLIETPQDLVRLYRTSQLRKRGVRHSCCYNNARDGSVSYKRFSQRKRRPSVLFIDDEHASGYGRCPL